jgi:ABC-type multidrug transport system permease subunit
MMVFGLCISLIFNKLFASQFVAIVILIFGITFSGILVPFFIINNNDFLRICSYLSPLKYINSLCQLSFCEIGNLSFGVQNGGIFYPFNNYCIEFSTYHSVVQLYSLDI